MNIAISTNSTWNFIKFRKGLANSLIKSGHKIFILSKNDKYKKYIPKEIKFIQIPINRSPISLLNDLLLVIFFFKILRIYRIDLFLGFSHKINVYGGLACKLKKIKCILNITGLGTAFIENNYIKKLIFLFYRLIKSKKSYFLFHNPQDKKLFIENKILNKENCFLIPGSGIEVKKKKIKKLTKKKKMKFLFIGRLLIHKGILEYLHAAEKLSEYNKNLYFNIIGRIDKSNTSSINNFLIKKYKKNKKIKFLGYKENINKYINLSDCIVLPSYREGLPRVILESLILERPVIATNVAGCKQIIKNNYNGFLCKVKNSISLKNTILKYINLSISERRKMGMNGRKLVEEKFNEKKVITTYFKIMKND